MFTGLMIAMLTTVVFFVYASTLTSIQTMTAIRKIPEKVLLYISGLMMVPTMWFFTVVEAKNNVDFTYMYEPLQWAFGILILICTALLMFYFYNILKAYIDNLTQEKEDLDAKEE